jgi:uncharacterized protein
MTGRWSVWALPVAMGAAVGVLQVGPVGAQAPPTPPQGVPQVTVTSRGEVQVTPDRARIQVGVETEARTAADAAAENNRKQTAVLAAIRALGIPQSAIRTLNYSVHPVQRWNERDRVTELVGYRVSNIVQVDAEKLDQSGPIIDAALKAGANRVAGLEFRLSDQARYRDSALVLAVQNARRQAEVAARAAGGTAVELLELNVMEMDRPEPRPQMMAAARVSDEAAPPTPVSEGTMTVSMVISTRWRFVQAR